MIRIRIRFELDLHLHSRVFIGTTRRGSFVSGLSRNRVGIASFFKFIVFNGRPYLSLFSWAGINASSEIFRKNKYYIHFLRSHRKFFLSPAKCLIQIPYGRSKLDLSLSKFSNQTLNTCSSTTSNDGIGKTRPVTCLQDFIKHLLSGMFLF